MEERKGSIDDFTWITIKEIPENLKHNAYNGYCLDEGFLQSQYVKVNM